MNSDSTKRLDELDSLRGLAALIVVLNHFVQLWTDDSLLGVAPENNKILDLLILPFSAGHEAVILFFILSGFVLSIPAVNRRAQNYPVFVVRRLFRIYVPYLAALALALAGNIFFYSEPSQRDCFGICWVAPVDWRLLMQHVIFLGRYNTNSFNPPIWTLIYEMRISLVFPLICAISLKLRPARSLILAAGISGVSIVMGNLLPSQSWAQLFLVTAHYATLFVVGIFLVRQADRIAKVFSQLSRSRKIAIAVLSALLFVYGRFALLVILHERKYYGFDDAADWLTAFGAVGFIVLCLNSVKCRRILLSGPIHSVGKMSYSIYLLHFIVMLVLVHLLFGKLPLPIIMVFCIVVVMVASFVFNRLVELPSISLGRKLSEYL